MDISSRLGPRARALRLAMGVVHNRDDAEDAVQNTLLSLCETRGNVSLRDDSPGTQVSLALSTLRRACVDITRERNRTATIDEQTACLTDLETRLLQRVEVCRALDALPDRWRQVVILIDLEQISYEEVAMMMKVSVKTVRSQLSRAHRRLRQNLTA